MGLIFIEKVKSNQKQFEIAVKKIADKYRINPNWLMGIMNSETGETFSPSIRNFAGSGATGLIQFMPSTAQSLGTSTDELASMSNVEQLDFVDKYIGYTMGWLGVNRIKDYDDLYLLIFYPKAIGESKSWSFPQYIYRQNAGMDVDNDGVITIRDFKKWIKKKIPKSYYYVFIPKNKDAVYMYLVGFLIITFTWIYFIKNGK